MWKIDGEERRMSEHIDKEKLLAILYAQRSKENGRKCNALKHRHYEEGNMHNHGVQILSKVILIVRGMEAEDGERS